MGKSFQELCWEVATLAMMRELDKTSGRKKMEKFRVYCVMDGHCRSCGKRMQKVDLRSQDTHTHAIIGLKEGDQTKQHVCEEMKKDWGKKRSGPMPIFVQRDGYWEMIKEVTQQPQEERSEMNNTLYSRTRTDSEGITWPVYGMTNGHIERLLAQKTKRFVDMREKMSGAPMHSDPAIMAIGKTQHWKPETLVKKTEELIEEISPFLQEALVRGGTVADAASKCMRAITKREGRVVIPREAVVESDEGKSELSWDRSDESEVLGIE